MDINKLYVPLTLCRRHLSIVYNRYFLSPHALWCEYTIDRYITDQFNTIIFYLCRYFQLDINVFIHSVHINYSLHKKMVLSFGYSFHTRNNTILYYTTRNKSNNHACMMVPLTFLLVSL